MAIRMNEKSGHEFKDLISQEEVEEVAGDWLKFYPDREVFENLTKGCLSDKEFKFLYTEAKKAITKKDQKRSYEKNRPKLAEERYYKHRCKEKVKAAGIAIYLACVADHIFSDKDWDEMLPSVRLANIIQTVAYRQNDASVILLAHAMNSGFSQRVIRESVGTMKGEIRVSLVPVDEYLDATIMKIHDAGKKLKRAKGTNKG